GKGWTNPNPLVGAVIVKDGKIIAEGYHHKYGELHAERDAIKNAVENNVDLSESEIYVTLEPCCHHGKQPPCVEAIVESGIKKVIIGSRDPNPLVNGGGVEYLKAHGIEVLQDFMKEECDALNPVFFHYIKNKMPYVILKYAMTMDGLTATSKGESKWITGDLARANVHKTRSEVMAVLTGIGTVMKDDPMLNVRLEGNYRQPVRVILDYSLMIPLESNLVKTAQDPDCGKVIVYMAEHLLIAAFEKMAQLKALGVEVVMVKAENRKLSVRAVLEDLAERKIDSVLVESGGYLNSSFVFNQMEEGEKVPFVNEVHSYIAPKIFGNDGNDVFNPVRGVGVDFPKDAVLFEKPEIEIFGDDILLRYKLKNSV
ncbi:MAG: bifunctional diaminohydroxyphosphoribosylaminopyrimidine deaminase/5-amino-6-(5-phosphoribosylamino)uracil reductase RibD, partial [Treponema sp.]|nr:bifunctional diaminohydroxyphosphoribosylaminopyrimidine deaminase/5-amino-6-(5-phosphoribosylamino)uracil reductase RibD [Candidatus Treponema equifaecale]